MRGHERSSSRTSSRLCKLRQVFARCQHHVLKPDERFKYRRLHAPSGTRSRPQGHACAVPQNACNRISVMRKKCRTAHSSYAVGYGCPPTSSQFQPGQSGNAKGRPKGRAQCFVAGARSPRAPDQCQGEGDVAEDECAQSRVQSTCRKGGRR
jgi:Family of unknown function (DUF5681)